MRGGQAAGREEQPGSARPGPARPSMAKHHRTPARSPEPVIEVKSKVSLCPRRPPRPAPPPRGRRVQPPAPGEAPGPCRRGSRAARGCSRGRTGALRLPPSQPAHPPLWRTPRPAGYSVHGAAAWGLPSPFSAGAGSPEPVSPPGGGRGLARLPCAARSPRNSRQVMQRCNGTALPPCRATAPASVPGTPVGCARKGPRLWSWWRDRPICSACAGRKLSVSGRGEEKRSRFPAGRPRNPPGFSSGICARWSLAGACRTAPGVSSASLGLLAGGWFS